MKRTWTALALAGAMVFQLAACGASNSGGGSSSANSGTESALVLSDQSVTLDGNTISEGTDGAVTVSHDIVYYQAGQGEDYGAGSADDEHTAEEAGCPHGGHHPQGRDLSGLRQPVRRSAGR